MKRILIANRGEIAVRIIRACRDLGYCAVALYTELDRSALHVCMADEAYPIDDYLNASGITELAAEHNIDGIHPGYGFLAENDEFARQVQAAGITWIGPAPEVIAQLGSKLAARQLAQDAKVPILPGTVDPVDTLDAAKAALGDIGFPIMLKAVAGGGGKGMRIVESADEFDSAFELARGEALSAFGNGAIYLERYVPAPHHIEVQLLADQHGTVLHCYERECSVQRRHQKLIEEAPSPFITPETRQHMCDAAVSLARRAGYDSVGTVEFLVDAEQEFYFLEVNTRIQVEHPITEMITGIDLVAEQIQIAFGEKLTLTQNDITPRGHAIECRLCAEDTEQNFMPAPGTIRSLVEPGGPNVRFDIGVSAGASIHTNYDPLIGKLCTWGRTREAAIATMQRALGECRITGLTSNQVFHQRALANADFLSGQYSTQFIATHRATLCHPETLSAQALDSALISAAISRALDSGKTRNAATPPSAWQQRARLAGVSHEN